MPSPCAQTHTHTQKMVAAAEVLRAFSQSYACAKQNTTTKQNISIVLGVFSKNSEKTIRNLDHYDIYL